VEWEDPEDIITEDLEVVDPEDSVVDQVEEDSSRAFESLFFVDCKYHFISYLLIPSQAVRESLISSNNCAFGIETLLSSSRQPVVLFSLGLKKLKTLAQHPSACYISAVIGELSPLFAMTFGRQTSSQRAST